MVFKFKLLLVQIICLSLISGCAQVSNNSDYDEFAKCITESGAKMYGAFWCSHCKDQKESFGSSWEKINYVECSLPDGQSQTQICIQEGITGYPTWEVGDGNRLSGRLSFEKLSEMSGCELNLGEN